MGFYDKHFDELEDRLRAVVPDCESDREGMAYHAMRLLDLARRSDLQAYDRDFYNVLWEQISSIEQVVKEEQAERERQRIEDERQREMEHAL